MKILLINNNPVVSRLTALSARKEEIEIDEIQEVTELNSNTYDIVFVDADSWTKDVKDVIAENITTQKSVLFYADGDEEEKSSFDLSILKPFLPSEVSAVIRSIEELEDAKENLDEVSHFDVIADAKESNREELFDLDGLEEKKVEPVATVIEDEKAKEVEDDLSFDDKLEEAFPLSINSLDDELFDDASKLELEIEDDFALKEEKVVEKKDDALENDLFDLDLSDDVPSLDDDLFSTAKSEDKEEVTLETLEISETSEALDELELDEVLEPIEKVEEVKVEEEKIETKILDKSEIENIKGILTEDHENDMSLEDLMPPIPTAALAEEPVKEEAVAKVADVDTPHIDSTDIAKSLATMPVQSLRELLAGATVNIKIKFPKLKK